MVAEAPVAMAPVICDKSRPNSRLVDREETYNILRQANINPFRIELPYIQEEHVDSLSKRPGFLGGTYIEAQDDVPSVSSQQRRWWSIRSSRDRFCSRHLPLIAGNCPYTTDDTVTQPGEC